MTIAQTLTRLGLRAKEERQRFDELCEAAPDVRSREEVVFWFVHFVAWLRPARAQDVEVKLRYVRSQLERHPAWRENVSRALSALVAQSNVRELLAYAGIARNFHFAGAVLDWAVSRLLPAACATDEAAQVFTLAFRAEDVAWLRQLARDPWWLTLVDAELRPGLEGAVAEALLDLAHQVVAQAHAPSVRNLAGVERSPFRGLYEAVAALTEQSDDARADALRGRLKQCQRVIAAYREGLAGRGADLNTTFQLTRLREQLQRLSLLAELRHEPSATRVARALVELIAASVRSAAGRRLLLGSSDLLLQNMIDTAASVGRSYLDTAQSSAGAAFRAGAWGGALMALATAVKFLLAALHLPALYEGLAFSLNYAAVFCAAYLLHFTIATKLPAHTAAALARCAQGEGGHRARLERFLGAWRTMVRLQLAGLIGNVVIAAPAAVGLAYLARLVAGHDLLAQPKAEHVLDAHSLLGPSVLYAALTGLLLWVSSLIGSIVDNWARVMRLDDRLATSLRAMRRAHAVRRRAWAEAIAARAGGLASNAALGFLLGGIPALFAIASLPVEIRHITVSVSSVAMALVTGAGSAASIGLAFAGLVAIASANVAVSFALALWLALRSTRMQKRMGSAHALVALGLRGLLRRTDAPLIRCSPGQPAPGPTSSLGSRAL